MGSVPSGDQKRLLERFGVAVPAGRGAARNLLSYLLSGNGGHPVAGGKDEASIRRRLIFFLRAQERWVGKTVRLPGKDDKLWVVTGVVARSRWDIPAGSRNPFRVVLHEFGGKKVKTLGSFTGLQVQERPDPP